MVASARVLTVSPERYRPETDDSNLLQRKHLLAPEPFSGRPAEQNEGQDDQKPAAPENVFHTFEDRETDSRRASREQDAAVKATTQTRQTSFPTAREDAHGVFQTCTSIGAA